MALRARLARALPEPEPGSPYHAESWTALSTLFMRHGDRRLEAENYLSSGYGIRIAIESKTSGWVKLGELAHVSQPPRTKATLVSKEFGAPFLIANQMFEIRPTIRKWLAVEKLSHAKDLFAERGEILVRRSANVGKSTLTFAPHLGALISDHFFRVRPKDEENRGWLYAYIRAPKVRAMMTGAKYGHIINHLEVSHLRALPIPEVPAPWRAHFAARVREILDLRDAAHAATLEAESLFEKALGPFKPGDSGETGFVVKASKTLFRGRRRFDAFPNNPSARAIVQHLRKFGTSITTLAATGYKVWLPNRFRRIPASDGVALIESSDFFEMNPDSEKRIAEVKFGDPYNGRVEPGWLVMARSGQIYGLLGGVAMTTTAHVGRVVTDDVLRIAPSDEAVIRSGYVFTVLTHPELGRPLVKSMAYGSSIPHIDAADLQNFPIVRLSPTTENAIADLAERSAELRARADLLEIEIATEAGALLDRFIAGEDLAPTAPLSDTAIAGSAPLGILPATETAMPGIEKTTNVCGGDACIARTRVPVWVLEQARRLGATETDLLADYPSLTAADLTAAWAYVGAHRREVESAIRANEEA